MHEQMEPVVVQQVTDRDDLDKLKRLVEEKHEERIRFIEYSLFKTSDQKPTVFDEIEQRFCSVDKRHVQDHHSLNSKIQAIKDYTANFEFLMQGMETKLGLFDQMVESFRKNLEDKYNEILQTKQSFMKSLD